MLDAINKMPEVLDSMQENDCSRSKGVNITAGKDYVLGFMFSEDHDHVVVIEKNKPEWQKGKLNVPGGKVDSGEKPIEAVIREFREETGYETRSGDWSHFARMVSMSLDDPFVVDCFVTTGDVQLVSTTAEERVMLLHMGDISNLCHKTIENLPWLLHMALGHL